MIIIRALFTLAVLALAGVLIVALSGHHRRCGYEAARGR